MADTSSISQSVTLSGGVRVTKNCTKRSYFNRATCEICMWLDSPNFGRHHPCLQPDLKAQNGPTCGSDLANGSETARVPSVHVVCGLGECSLEQFCYLGSVSGDIFNVESILSSLFFASADLLYLLPMLLLTFTNQQPANEHGRTQPQRSMEASYRKKVIYCIPRWT